VLAAAHTCWIVYEETALGHFSVAFTSFTLVQSVIGVLFLLMVLNSVLKRTVRSWMLSPAEMMVIFCTMTIASVIAGFDLLQNLVPVLLWPFYYGGSDSAYSKFLPNMPRWFVPQDPLVIKQFLVGSNDLWHFFSPAVLRAWAVPMAFWMAFLFLLAWTMLCVGSVMRRQWVEREKLSFPLLELPVSMARGNTAGSMLRQPLFLIGFLGTMAILSVNCLSGIFPAVPGIRLNVTNVGHMAFLTPPLSGMNPVFVAWWPYAIGLCYLIPLDISFSCWFFYVFIRLAAAFGTAMGWRTPDAGFSPNQFPWFQDLTSGAWMTLFFVVMWGARSHLAHAWRMAMGKVDVPDDAREPMSYRLAFFGAIIGFALLMAIAIVAGMQPYLALLFFTIYFLAIVVMTRIYAQIAVPIFELAFFSPSPAITSMVGTNALTRQDATILTSFYWFNRCYRQHPMGHELESMVFAEKLGQRTRPMFYIILAALVVGIVVGMLTTMQIYYSRGAASAKVTGSQIGVGAEAWNLLASSFSNPHGPQMRSIAVMGASSLIVIGLTVARGAWFEFPLHPIGYAFACSYAMEYIWAVVLVTWLIKLLVIRYGGLKTYRRSLPLFFGIILGDAVTQVVSGLVMGALGVQGATPYLDIKW